MNRTYFNVTLIHRIHSTVQCIAQHNGTTVFQSSQVYASAMQLVRAIVMKRLSYRRNNMSGTAHYNADEVITVSTSGGSSATIWIMGNYTLDTHTHVCSLR